MVNAKGYGAVETCVILAGGRGTRLQSVSRGRNKHASLLAGKTALAHVLEPVFVTPSVDKIVVVIQPHDQEWMEGLLASLGREDIPIRIQPVPNGTLAAVQCALPEVDTEIFSVHYGDNIFGWNLLPDIAPFAAGPDAAELYALDDLSHALEYGVLDMEETGTGFRASRFVEKPPSLAGFRQPRVLTGFFRFRTIDFLRASRDVPLSPRGEFELTDTVHRLMRPPFSAAVRSTGSGWIDFGTPEKFARVEEVLGERTTGSYALRSASSSASLLAAVSAVAQAQEFAGPFFVL